MTKIFKLLSILMMSSLSLQAIENEAYVNPHYYLEGTHSHSLTYKDGHSSSVNDIRDVHNLWLDFIHRQEYTDYLKWQKYKDQFPYFKLEMSESDFQDYNLFFKPFMIFENLVDEKYLNKFKREPFNTIKNAIWTHLRSIHVAYGNIKNNQKEFLFKKESYWLVLEEWHKIEKELNPVTGENYWSQMVLEENYIEAGCRYIHAQLTPYFYQVLNQEFSQFLLCPEVLDECKIFLERWATLLPTSESEKNRIAIRQVSLHGLVTTILGVDPKIAQSAAIRIWQRKIELSLKKQCQRPGPLEYGVSFEKFFNFAFLLAPEVLYPETLTHCVYYNAVDILGERTRFEEPVDSYDIFSNLYDLTTILSDNIMENIENYTLKNDQSARVPNIFSPDQKFKEESQASGKESLTENELLYVNYHLKSFDYLQPEQFATAMELFICNLNLFFTHRADVILKNHPKLEAYMNVLKRQKNQCPLNEPFI